MNEDAFEGSLILEMLAELGLVDDFYEAIDSDNISKAISLMRRAQVDEETIEIAVRKMQESDGQH
jgi:hypothetical protein